MPRPTFEIVRPDRKGALPTRPPKVIMPCVLDDEIEISFSGEADTGLDIPHTRRVEGERRYATLSTLRIDGAVDGALIVAYLPQQRRIRTWLRRAPETIGPSVFCYGALLCIVMVRMADCCRGVGMD